MTGVTPKTLSRFCLRASSGTLACVAHPLVIVSADAHIGPRLVEDLRPLCPPALLSAFDAYVDDTDRSKGRYVEHDASSDDELSPWRNQWADGHHDPQARRR